MKSIPQEVIKAAINEYVGDLSNSNLNPALIMELCFKRAQELAEQKEKELRSSSNYFKHAERELALIGMGEDADGMNLAMRTHLLHMLGEFSDEGHSGFSASYASKMLEKLFMFEPLSPLTGEDSEWNEVGNNLFQNNRCGNVFKQGKDGQAYDSEGRIFRTPSGSCYTSSNSRVPVTFPYIPKREYVNVQE